MPCLRLRRQGVPLSVVLTSLLSFCFVPSAAAQPSDSTQTACRSVPDSEVITRQDIRNAGFARLSDVLQLADRWHTASIDGYTRDAQASGLSFLSNPRWAVLVDGAPVEIGLFGTQSLDALPIHLNEVACIELVARPHVAAGILHQSGAVHIHTQRPETGMTLSASVSAGNEVNDPGPFAYTPAASTNIDRIGPIGTGSIEIRSGGRYARLSGKLDEFHVTDQQIDRRARQLFNIDSKPRINAQAVAITAGSKTPWGTQRLLAGRSETNDLLFFETFGHEIPSDRRVDVLAATGVLRFGGGELRYRGSYVSHELLERPNARDIDLQFKKQVISGGLDSQVGAGPLRMTVGGSVDIVNAQTNQRLLDDRSMITRLYGQGEFSIADRLSGSVSGWWIQAEDLPAVSAISSIRLLLSRDRWMAAHVSYASRILEMDASLWRWTYLDYTLPSRSDEDGGSSPSGPAPGTVTDFRWSPRPRMLTADAEVGGRMPEGVDYLVGTYYRRSLADYVADHDIHYVEESTGFLTRTRIFNYVSGDIIGVHAGLGLNLIPGFTQRITYVAEGVVSSHVLFERAHARVPSQRFAITATFAPNDRFSLFARARYQPATIWSEYEAASVESDQFYVSQLPERVLVDVAATKRFWHEHLVATLSVRNLLNEPYRAHPAGAVFNMSFHFTINVSFNSEARP